MVSINLIYDKRYEDRYEPFRAIGNLLADLSLTVLHNHPDAKTDTSVVQSHLLGTLRADGDRRVAGPIIVNERADQETVKVSNRALLKEATTIGWFKECVIRDPTLHNAPAVKGYYHFGLMDRDLERYPAVAPMVKLDAGDIAKIHLPFSVASYSEFDPYRARRSPPPHERDIDALMYGTANYPESEILTGHRLLGTRAMGRLGKRRTLLAIGYFLDQMQLDDFVYRSKIVVSPYGFSMSSYKDWRALYCGCVLIKPDSQLQVNYLPDLFKDNAWYVPCRADFADLEEKVDMVLSDYDRYFEQAQIARSALLQSGDLERRASDFYHLLMRILERAPSSEAPNYAPIEPGTYRTADAAPRDAVPVAMPRRQSVNLLGDEPGLDDPVWEKTRATLAARPASGPGGVRVWKLQEDTSDTTHDVRRSVATATEAGPFAASFFAKADERNEVELWLHGADTGDRAWVGFDLAAGQVWDHGIYGREWSSPRSGMIPCADGWWWCWLSANTDAARTLGVQLTLRLEHDNYIGDGSSGAWLGGVRLEAGATPTLSLPPAPPTTTRRRLFPPWK